MANIYDVSAGARQANIPAEIQSGIQAARQNTLGNIAVQQAQQQQQDTQTLRGLAPGIVAGDPTAYAQAAAINPDQANNFQGAADQQLTKLRGAINYIDQQKTPEAKEAAYQNAVRPYLAAIGAAQGKVPPATFAEAAPMMEAARGQIAGLGPAPNSALINVGAGGAVLDPVTRKPIFINQNVKPELVTGADGRQYWASPGGPATPIQIANGQPNTGGGSAAPTGLPAETRAYIPSVIGRLNGAPALNADGTASPALINALVGTESGGNPNAVSTKGAQGLTQVMPATGANPGFGVTPLQNNSQAENLRFGQDYLNAMLKRYNGDVPSALAAYNAGPGAVDAANGQPSADNTLMGVPKRQTFSQLSPDEVAAAGLPKGTVAQRGSDGKIDVIAKGTETGNIVAPGDTTKNGDDYLASLPPSTARLVRAIANGDKAAPSASSRSPEAQQLLQAVYQYDPSASDTNLPTRTALQKSFTSGADSKNLTALAQFAAHAEQLHDMIPQLSGLAIPFVGTGVNAAINKGSDPYNGALTSWEEKADAVAHEGRSVFAGASGGTLAELEKQASRLGGNSSTQQKQAALASIADLVRSRINIMQDKYDSGMGPLAKPLEVASPHVRDVLNSLATIDHGTQARQATQAQAPAAQAQGQYRATNPQTGHTVIWNGSAWVDE